ncbi:MAG: 50S ribosomal protein L1 [Candidatus Levybacteria bacterium]|nr:50S ribosomal protein L1 [Candidatus Levybacteria bacterium]
MKLEKAKTKKQAKKRTRSKRYDVAAKLVDKTKKYSLSEALALLPKLHIAKFDESIELHINTLEQGVSGIVSLPHGTGKKIRVVIADDKLIEDIIKEKINFDILLAEPSMMAKLAKVAKILGPRGLMPNPKNGTITANPEDAIKKFKAGQIRFKTETKAPIIHLTVGKISFGEKKLTDNITTILNAVQKQKIKNVTLKSTMSPGIKLDISTA